MKAQLSLENYRCFSPGMPATFEFGGGETAFVGVNNAGKSTLLRSLYEFRPFFGNLAGNPADVCRYLTGELPAPLHGTYHQFFNTSNSSAMSISLSVDAGAYAAAGGDPVFDPSTEDVPVKLIFTFGHHTSHCAARLITRNNQSGSFIRFENGRLHYPQPSQPVYFAHYLDALARMSRAVYVGPFRNILGHGGTQPYYDAQIGTQLITGWDQRKNGDDPRMFAKIKAATQMLANIYNLRHLDIQANYNKDDFLIETDLGRHPLSSMGAGFSQFLLLFANLLDKDPTLLLIDEPESNLHPCLQIEFIEALRSFASDGVVFATHSIGLARAAAERIYSIRVDRDGRRTVRPWERTSRLSELAGEMGYTAYQDLGFEKILLVEGPTEVKTVQQILRMFRRDHKVVCIPLGGSGMITGDRQLELEELKRLTPHIHAMIDSEKKSDSDPIRSDRQAFVVSCKDAGIQCHVTELRATENYLTQAAIEKAKRSTKYRALKPFESLEDAPEPKWGKSENWLIAREMAAEDWRKTDVGQFLDSL